MRRLHNIPIAGKLMVLSGVLMVAVCTVGLVGYRGVAGLRKVNEQSGIHLGAVRNVLQARAALDTVQSLVLWQMLNTNNAQSHAIEETVIRLEGASVEATTYLGELKSVSSQEEVITTISLIVPMISEYVSKGKDLVKLAALDRTEETNTKLTEFQDTFLQLSQAMELLSDMEEAEATATKERGIAIGTKASRTALWVLAGTVLLTSLLGFTISRLITKPLKQVTAAAQKIALGDVHQHVDYHATDETGALATAFRDLIAYLRSMAGAADRISNGDLTARITPRSEKDVLSHSFQRMVDNLHTTSEKIQEGAQLLSASLWQISASVSQLTASTTETATTVGQTATTVIEVKQTAHVANNKAQQVATDSQQTARIGQEGDRAVEQAITGMEKMRAQMESIAQSVIRLGEQSQSIDAIVSTMTEFAEQSNLLAVNAAIEAAKAGESGKGFAVVAHEVKHLAEGSKQAGIKIREILRDVQQATQVAVLVTEQGTKSADAGVRQSLAAGEAIRSLVKSINEAAHAVIQIAASSQQQLIGMEQMATAMESIKQATGQNVGGMKQIESAVHNLQTVSQTLKEVATQYKLRDEASASTVS